jgi:hypothetical protein
VEDEMKLSYICLLKMGGLHQQLPPTTTTDWPSTGLTTEADDMSPTLVAEL